MVDSDGEAGKEGKGADGAGAYWVRAEPEQYALSASRRRVTPHAAPPPSATTLCRIGASLRWRPEDLPWRKREHSTCTNLHAKGDVHQLAPKRPALLRPTSHQRHATQETRPARSSVGKYQCPASGRRLQYSVTWVLHRDFVKLSSRRACDSPSTCRLCSSASPGAGLGWGEKHVRIDGTTNDEQAPKCVKVRHSHHSQVSLRHHHRAASVNNNLSKSPPRPAAGRRTCVLALALRRVLRKSKCPLLFPQRCPLRLSPPPSGGPGGCGRTTSLALLPQSPLPRGGARTCC